MSHATGMRSERRSRAVPGSAMGCLLGAALLVLVSACTAAAPQESGGLSPGGSDGQTASGAVVATGTDLIAPDSGAASATDGDDTTADDNPVDGPPAAAVLGWLDGPADSGGVVTGDAPLQQWVGRAAGERATLGDGWYRYFGPDGSLVGCTSAGSCVGVGSDGTVAVTRKPGGARQVYRADGSYLGEFSPDGDKLGAVEDPADMVPALAATGVDVAGLVNSASRGAPFAGGVTGDPHLITMGGHRYSTQAAGQFIARTGDRHHEIQLQFSAMAHRDDVSIVSMIGIGTDSNTITMDAAGTLTVNGKIQSRTPDFEQTALSDGVVVGRWPADNSGPVTVAVVWPDGGTIVAAAHRALGITAIAHLPQVATAAGLFGTSTVRSGPDLTTPSGTLATAAGGTAGVVASWRVRPSEQLLPAVSAPLSRLAPSPVTTDPSAQKIAQRLCSAQGINGAQDLSACAFDIAVTGDTGFIPGHVALALAAQSTAVPASFARRWPALVAGPAGAATDLPRDRAVDIALAAAGAQLYRLRTDAAGPLLMDSSAQCSGAAGSAAEPGIDQPAWRLFDDTGRPVADRLALCGTTATGAVPAGNYLLDIANGVGAPPLHLHATVTLP